MDVDKHGGGPQVIDLDTEGYNVGVVLYVIPNLLGTSGKLVEAMVNKDSDTWKDPRGLESAETEGVLENVVIRSTYVLHVPQDGVMGPLVGGGDVVDEGL
jgi:hypothetical protein